METLHVEGPVAVLGDIHGRADLLMRLLALLGTMPIFVVGDVCDRGPDTRGVVELLSERGARGVRGNHEEWLCAYASGQGFDTAALHAFMGGRATLESYGITGSSPREIEEQRHRVPAAHREWLQALPTILRLMVDGAPFWLAHAGVSADLCAGLDPQVHMPNLAREKPQDFLWRAQATDDMAVLDGPVVFGHVPRRVPVDAGHAIGIDTGCGVWADGALTAVILPERRFVSVRDDES
jgi:serine/threonine protein phosphatase 1